MIYNILVALSNYTVLPLVLTNTSAYKYLTLLPMTASFIYHLAETKHNLPGVYPLNTYSYQLLNLDRLFAVLSGGLVVCILLKNPKLITLKLLSLGLVGVTSLLYSERDKIPGLTIRPFSFLISHTVWHITAFYILNHCIKHL